MEKPLKIISEIKTPRLTARPAATAMADGLFHAIDILSLIHISEPTRQA